MLNRFRAGTQVWVMGDPAQPPLRGTVVCFYRAYPNDLMVRFPDGAVERVPREVCEVVQHAS